jgi:endonuclease YncB( thermonuclease family)
VSVSELLYYSKILKYDVYDGDTTYAVLDLGHRVALSLESIRDTWMGVRIVGVDAPEYRPLKSRAAGQAVRDVVRELFKRQKKLVVHSVSLDDAYAQRFSGDILWDEPDGSVGRLSAFLLKHKLARAYDYKKDGKRKPWPKVELEAVTQRAAEVLEQLTRQTT